MNSATKRIIAAIILLLGLVGGYYVFSVMSENESLEKEKKDRIFWGLQKSDIKNINFTNSYGAFKFERQADGDFYMIEPVNVRADSLILDRMMASLVGMVQTRVVEENAKDLGKYGLDNPSTIVTFTTFDGAGGTIHFGRRTPVGTSVYFLLEGENKIRKSSAFNKLDFADPADVMMDKHLSHEWFGQDDSGYEFHVLTKPPKIYEVRRQEGQGEPIWTFIRPFTGRVSTTGERSLRAAVVGTEASRILAQNEEPGEEVWEKAKLKMKVFGNDGSQFLEIVIGPEIPGEKGMCYVRSSAVPWVGSIPCDSVGKAEGIISNIKADYLVSFWLAEVTGFEIAHQGYNGKFELKGNEWIMTEPGKAMADSDVIINLLGQFDRLKANNHFPLPPDGTDPYGFSEPSMKMTIWHSSGGGRTELIGGRLVPGTDNTEMYIYDKMHSDVLSVSVSFLNSIPKSVDKYIAKENAK